MDLYFAPLACSMSSRIALYEAGAAARFVQVDTRAHRVADGGDFFAVTMQGQVPALATDDGETLTENPAVLQFIADRNPESGLAPPAGSMARYRLQQWLNFVTSELHKVVFIVWGVLFGLHFLAYAPRVLRSLAHRPRVPGGGWRSAAIGVALGSGLTVALALLGLVTAWHGGHHHHER